MGLLHSVVFAFSERTRQLLHDSTMILEPIQLEAPLDLLLSITQVKPEIVVAEELRMFLPDFFVFGFLFPRSAAVNATPQPAFGSARQIWTTSLSLLDSECMGSLTSSLTGVLRDLVLDLDSRPS